MSFGDVLWIIVGGGILGVIAKLFLSGRQDIGFWWTIGAGVVGMLVGDWLARLLGVEVTSGFDWIRHGLQVLVAIVAVMGIVALQRSRKGAASV